MADEIDDPDNPEWFDEDFGKARPAQEVHPPEIIAWLVRAATDRTLVHGMARQTSLARAIRLAA